MRVTVVWRRLPDTSVNDSPSTSTAAKYRNTTDGIRHLPGLNAALPCWATNMAAVA